MAEQLRDKNETQFCLSVCYFLSEYAESLRKHPVRFEDQSQELLSLSGFLVDAGPVRLSLGYLPQACR